MKQQWIVRLIVFCALWISLIFVTPTSYAQPTEPIPVECGTAIHGLFIEHGHTEQFYTIDLHEGDSLHAIAHTRGDFTMPLNIGVFSPSGQNLNDRPDWHIGDFYEHPTKSMVLENLPETGIYEIIVLGGEPGAYTLGVGCTLKDGTIIEPGSAQFDTISAFDSLSGYGFPRLEQVAFADIPNIPLTIGQVYTDSLGEVNNAPTLYTYNAKANETVKLSISRISGDLSIGVVIINLEDNSLVFFTGMPFANSLTTAVTFPTDGNYTLGVFRLDFLPDPFGTSGTFELQLR